HGNEPFAPPFLEHGDLLIAQTALILQYVAPRIGVAPASEHERLHAHQHQLTITDFVLEAHDVHHPIASSLYYDDQKPESARRAPHFIKDRITKYMGYFERALARSGGEWTVGKTCTYVDLSLFHTIEGLRYAFPNAMKAFEPSIPGLVALHGR